MTNKDPEESCLLIKHAHQIASDLGGAKLLIKIETFIFWREFESIFNLEQIIWLTSAGNEEFVSSPLGKNTIHLPQSSLTRMSQIRLGLFLAFLKNNISFEEKIICLSGESGFDELDTMYITDSSREFPWLTKVDIEESHMGIATREFASIIDIVLRFAEEGREGNSIGTIFVLGDVQELQPYLRQLVLNPCKGHPRKQLSVHHPGLFETLREFAALDGGFVVSRQGTVVSAGTYFDAPAPTEYLSPGLGARHAAAMGITVKSSAVAIALSESSGTVTIFQKGKKILELEKPKAAQSASV